MTFCGTWRCFCLHVCEIKLTDEQPTMSHSASLYSNTRKLLQFIFLLPRWRFWWRCVSIWTLYNAVVTLRNLRLAFRQPYFICSKYIQELCIFFIIKKDYFPIQPQVNGFHNRDGECFLHGMISIIKYQSV